MWSSRRYGAFVNSRGAANGGALRYAAAMLTTQSDDLELQAARDQWRRMASMQGLLCVTCLEAPALEHRPAFYDTGLCETCSAAIGAGEAAA